jgi:hypothetical protein
MKSETPHGGTLNGGRPLTQPTNQDNGAAPDAVSPTRAKRRLAFRLAVLALIALGGLAGTGVACWLRPPDVSENKDDAKRSGPLAPYFHGWDKPDLVLVLSADQHGYLLPCGCSRPQVGGLERRYNLIQLLKQRGWPVVAVDLGNVPQVEAPAALPNVQGLIKYRYAMRAMKAMGYTAVGIGDFEASMPLAKVLDSVLNDPKPDVVSADLMDRDNKYPGETQAWRLADPVKGVDFKVGVTAVLGPSVYEQIQKKDSSAKFAESAPALKAALKEMQAAKVDLPVLLYMGSLAAGRDGSPPEAQACIESFPQFPLVVAQDGSDLARSVPIWVQNPKTKAKTMLVSLGYKGKAVGVVGVYRTGKPDQPFDLRYQMVDMTEDFATPPDREKDHAILKLMEEYTKELKDQNYLALVKPARSKEQAGQDPMPKYVGTLRCRDCHKSAYNVWEHSKHHDAYQTLVDAKRPSNRQYDPECVVCHTVGFGNLSGYKAPKERPERDKELVNVGCENCHGPGSLHANDANNPVYRAAMNPWKAPPGEKEAEKVRRVQRIDDACQKCHDPENDVHWTEHGLKEKWPQIAHPTPPEEKQQDASEPADDGKQ